MAEMNFPGKKYLWKSIFFGLFSIIHISYIFEFEFEPITIIILLLQFYH